MVMVTVKVKQTVISFISTERYSLVWYGTQVFVFPPSKGCQITIPYWSMVIFGHPFVGVQGDPKGSQEVRATHIVVH